MNAPLTFTATGALCWRPIPAGTTSRVRPSTCVPQGKSILTAGRPTLGKCMCISPRPPARSAPITVTATSGGKSTSLSTTAVASDPNTAPPSNLDVQSNSDIYTTVSFTPSDASLPVSIEVSLDGGITWSTWGVAEPGDTTLTLYGLPKGHPVVDPGVYRCRSQQHGWQSDTNGVQANGIPAPTPTSAPTIYIRTTQYSRQF